MNRCLWVGLIVAVSYPTVTRPAELPHPSASAAWELRLLGLGDTAKFAELREFPKQRRVELGIVGQGGVSQEQLRAHEAHGHTFTYHDYVDPKRNTHDTAMVRGILGKLSPLGVEVDLHLWMPGEPPAEIAEDFREAGLQCDDLVGG